MVSDTLSSSGSDTRTQLAGFFNGLREEKNLLVAQTLIYHSHTVQHFDTEGGWSFHGNEESSKEARKKSGKEEEVAP
jgi:hypothetical protein